MNNDNELGSGAAAKSEGLGRLAYSVPEAAAVTGLGKTTLYALIGSGKLPSCTIGRRRLIASADLEQLIGQRPKTAA